MARLDMLLHEANAPSCGFLYTATDTRTYMNVNGAQFHNTASAEPAHTTLDRKFIMRPFTHYYIVMDPLPY